MRELAALALSPAWTMKDALALVPADAEPRSLSATYAAGIAPLERQEPNLNGPLSARVRDALKPIGMKIRPDMNDTAKAEWLSAMLIALADLPPQVIGKAALQAIRQPIQFLSEVDGAVRKAAEVIMERHRTALLRLQRLEQEIARAKEPKLEAPEGWQGQEMPAPSADDLRRFAGSEVGRAVLSLGLKAGHISQEDYDAARATNEAEA